MSLGSRLAPAGDPAQDPEDFFEDALGVVFEDDAKGLHGDPKHGLLYTSPHLPQPLHISLADPTGDQEHQLFSHYLWNSSLLLAEFIEAGTLLARNNNDVTKKNTTSQFLRSFQGPPINHFDITNLSIIEIGAGTALPSLLAALLGASDVHITDYPAPSILANLRANTDRNLQPSFSPFANVCPSVQVEGHAWGQALPPEKHHAFDRVLAADCLWMPGEHENLLRSIEWFLAEDGRCWVIGGLHTGRRHVARFFRERRLRSFGLEVEKLWERDYDGAEREWSSDRGVEDPGERKRWLVCGILRRKKVEGQ